MVESSGDGSTVLFSSHGSLQMCLVPTCPPVCMFACIQRTFLCTCIDNCSLLLWGDFCSTFLVLGFFCKSGGSSVEEKSPFYQCDPSPWV